MTTDNKFPSELPMASWFHNLHALSRAAEDTHKQSEKMRQRGGAIRIEADSLAKFGQLDSNNRLGDRINCTRAWHDLLVDARDNLLQAMRRLADTKSQTDHFLSTLADAIMVNVECLTHRDTRKYGEYVNDPVQEALRKEAQVQLEIREKLQAALDEAILQQSRMLVARDNFYNDISDKMKTIHIDVEQYNRNEKSGKIGFKPFCDRPAENHLDLQTWDDLSRSTLEKSQQEILNGIATYEHLFDEMNKAADRLKYQADMVSEKLRRRIFEEKTAIRELEYQKKILEAERVKLLHDLRSWESSKSAKMASLKLAQSRREARIDRPGNENDLDAPFFGLKDECGSLVDALDALDEQLNKGRENLQQVEDRMASICEDLRNKTFDLSVEENLVGIRMRLEKPPAISYTICPLGPDGVIREKINFY